MPEQDKSGGEQGSLQARPSFARSAFLTYGTNLSAALLSFVSVLITARALGAAGRGDIAFLTTVAFLTAQMTSLGVGQANANFAAREPHLTPALAGNSVALASLTGGAAALLLGGLMIVFPGLGGGAGAGLLALVLASIPMLILQEHLLYLVQAHYGFGVTNASWLVTPVLNVVVNGLLAAFGALTVATAVATWIGGMTLGTVVMAWAVVRRLGGFGRPDPPLARRQLGFGLKAHLGRAMLFGNYRADQWILGVMSSSKELGLYSVAVAWSEVLFFLPTTLVAVQRPDLVRASPGEARERAVVVLRGALALTLICSVGMVLLAPFLCTTIFGDSFSGSVEMLRVLALGAFGITTLKLLGNALTAQRRPLLETGAVAVAFVTVFALDFALIPDHGGLGASIASAVSYTLGGVAAAIIFSRALGATAMDLVPRPGDLVSLGRSVRGRFRPAAQASGD
ncbi:MAG TPA: oligosaccharide flippase family protein [Thermoleophilaceae bacterium]|nr:oligosaccharide flippase family protein [Thermoleophilaceae bacterium]